MVDNQRTGEGAAAGAEFDYADVASSLDVPEMPVEQLITEAPKQEESTVPRILCLIASFAGIYTLYPDNLSFVLMVAFSYGCLISSVHAHFTCLTCLLSLWFPIALAAIAQQVIEYFTSPAF